MLTKKCQETSETEIYPQQFIATAALVSLKESLMAAQISSLPEADPHKSFHSKAAVRALCHSNAKPRYSGDSDHIIHMIGT